MRYSQEQAGLKGDVRKGPVHQDHLCVLNVFSELQQQEHSPAVQVWGKKQNQQKTPGSGCLPQGGVGPDLTCFGTDRLFRLTCFIQA